MTRTPLTIDRVEPTPMGARVILSDGSELAGVIEVNQNTIPGRTKYELIIIRIGESR